jgi:hypothetical protein
MHKDLVDRGQVGQNTFFGCPADETTSVSLLQAGSDLAHKPTQALSDLIE